MEQDEFNENKDILNGADENETPESFDDFIRRKACATPASELRMLPNPVVPGVAVDLSKPLSSETDENGKSKFVSNAQPAVVIVQRPTQHSHQVVGSYISWEDEEVQFTEERRLFMAETFENFLKKTPEEIIEHIHKLNYFITKGFDEISAGRRALEVHMHGLSKEQRAELDKLSLEERKKYAAKLKVAPAKTARKAQAVAKGETTESVAAGSISVKVKKAVKTFHEVMDYPKAKTIEQIQGLGLLTADAKAYIDKVYGGGK